MIVFVLHDASVKSLRRSRSMFTPGRVDTRVKIGSG